MKQEQVAVPHRLTDDRLSEVPTFNQIRHLFSSLGTGPGESNVCQVVSLIAATGIRPGELQTLLWSDVDFEQRSMFVRSCKTGIRVVPLGPGVLGLLRALRDQASDSDHVVDFTLKA